jgi:chromosome segregation ATPase
MTELERTLKNTLLTLEHDLTATQKTHSASLVNHQHSLESHAQAIRQLQEKIEQLQTEQAESARHLQRLSDIHANLEPLLSRLSALLNAR